MRKISPAARAEPETDARVERSKKAVLAATYKLMSESGLSGTSIDAIARQSGVAKATIYRHWPSRSALLLDACAKLGQASEPPDTGSLKGDMMALAERLAHQLKSARWAVILPSIIDAAERDAEIAALHAGLHAGFMTGFRAAIERAQRKGELPRAKDPAELTAAIAGPLFYRRWFSREPLDDRFVKAVVESAVRR